MVSPMVFVNTEDAVQKALEVVVLGNGEFRPGGVPTTFSAFFISGLKGLKMQWLRHDSDAHRDMKLRLLYRKYGFEGLGIYWTVVELIAGEMTPKNATCELELTTEFMAEDFKIEQIRLDAILNFCCEKKLFDRGPTGNLRCLKLLERLDNTLSKNKEILKIKSEGKKFLLKSEDEVFGPEYQVFTDEMDEKTLDEIKREEIKAESVLGRPLDSKERQHLKLSIVKKQKSA